MGFRDVQAFNLSLLAKQAWRFIHKTHSLFYKVYKSRYFPNCSFMDAELGINPSYVWRSLLAARDVIIEGSKWKVGDGRSIGVLTHIWLSHKLIFLGEQQPGLMVKDLIDSNTMQWDREKIFDLFAHRRRMEILSIPLQQNIAVGMQ
ncbi:putative mitochondrial protein AtMg00310 [Castanea sativa]|uniref:putative mitochondrial protein AtMg00310 n=1 Tax=Castanea sativa TaxID=21020 RepID=UPI003F64FEA7